MKLLVKRIVRRLGFDFHRYQPELSPEAQLIALLSRHRVNLVLDVGASAGQFGQWLRQAGYRQRLVSFEPLEASHEQLLIESEKDAEWAVAPRAAIGSEDGDIDIHVSGNSGSSSVLPMLEAHASAMPGSRYVGSERVPLRRLDALAAEYLRPDSVAYLKIDTQGYEDRVLLGAAEVLDRVVGIQVELSLVPLYEGQRLFGEMIDMLEAKGYGLWAMWPVFTDPNTGRLLQVDAVFFRS